MQTQIKAGYHIDCLSAHALRTPGKTRLKWSYNVLTDTSSIEAMLAEARHFTGVAKWRVAARYIAQTGRDTLTFLPVKIEREFIEAALLAASSK